MSTEILDRLAAKRQRILEELSKLTPQLPTKADRTGLIAQMRYLDGQLDLIDEILNTVNELQPA